MPYSAENVELKRESNRRYKAKRREELGLPPSQPKPTPEQAYANRLESNRRWRKRHPKLMQEYGNAYAHRHPNRRLWSVAKQRAKKRGVDFSISYEDVVVPEVCPVLGMKLVLGVGTSGRQGGNPDSPSLDRIDPSRGYVPGNVWVISHLANSMKGAASKDQLRKFAQWVLKNG